jgi:hypothetical protein
MQVIGDSCHENKDQTEAPFHALELVAFDECTTILNSELGHPRVQEVLHGSELEDSTQWKMVLLLDQMRLKFQSIYHVVP